MFLKTEHASKDEGQRERRENVKQALHSAQRSRQGSIPRRWDHDLSQNQESDAQLTEPPGHPKYFIFYTMPDMQVNTLHLYVFLIFNIWIIYMIKNSHFICIFFIVFILKIFFVSLRAILLPLHSQATILLCLKFTYFIVL